MVVPGVERLRHTSLDNEGSGVGGFVLEVSREHLSEAVVPCEAVDTRLDENQTELGVLVLAVLLQVLADGHGLLDEAVEVLRELGSQTLGAEDAHDLVAGNHLHLGNAVGVAENNTDLGRGVALLGHVADLLDGVRGALLHPRWGSALVWEGSTGDTLTFAVHATHGSLLFGTVTWLCAPM